MFVDQAKIYVKAGDGGNGCLAFRREKYVPKGGPSGGNGGNGGDVIVRSTVHLNTLLNFKYRQHYQAERGGHGQGSNRHGKDGANCVFEAPVGTQIFDAESHELICDLDRAGLEILLAKGGRGGRGNAAFATSTNRAPRRVEPGFPGEERVLQLELKVLADVGLVGYPNAGKSTLISVISAAKPKIADYPFTTLSPNLGVVQSGEFTSFVVADIPGLIEGAHSGIGLGDHFLRHVERTRVLAHLVDVSELGEADPTHAYETIRRELGLYSPKLEEKKEVVVASKLDVADPARLERLRDYCAIRQLSFFAISAATGRGVRELKDELTRLLQEGRQ